jgi:cytochrome c oxidase assembly protein subunit 20
MADDTRQTEEQVAPRQRAPANIMPGGTAHTAGGEKADSTGPSYIDAVRSLGPEYYLNFHKRPCVRDSQLQGLAAGFAGGSLAAILGSMALLLGSGLAQSWTMVLIDC